MILIPNLYLPPLFNAISHISSAKIKGKLHTHTHIYI